MEKKINFILIAFLLTFIFEIPFLHSQTVDSVKEDLEGKIQTAQDIKDQLEQSPSDYLKREWTKILEKSEFGKVLLNISNFLTNLNPLFKVILGMEYSLSWAFIFAVIIWLTFFFFLFGLGKGVFPDKKIITLVLALVISLLLGISGVIKELVDLLGYLVKDPWVASLAFISALVIMSLIIKFSGGFGEYIRRETEKLEKMKTKGDRKLIEASAEGLREGLETKKK